jgi:hypothetical protein
MAWRGRIWARWWGWSLSQDIGSRAIGLLLTSKLLHGGRAVPRLLLSPFFFLSSEKSQSGREIQHISVPIAIASATASSSREFDIPTTHKHS